MLIEASAGKLAGRRRCSRNFRYRFLMPWTLVLEKNFAVRLWLSPHVKEGRGHQTERWQDELKIDLISLQNTRYRLSKNVTRPTLNPSPL